jgi:hypothetical protein
LIELEPQALGIDDAQTEELFSEGLSAPEPFAKNAITNADYEKGQRGSGAGEIGADDSMA